MAGETIETVFRDFVTAGIPSSGFHEPRKPEIRNLLNAFLAQQTGNSAGLTIKTSLVSLQAYTPEVVIPETPGAWVIGDSTSSNDGVYRYVSAAWVKVGPLPYNIIHLNNAGAGTANAIQVTTAFGIPAAAFGALYLLNVVATNSGTVTVSINGAAAKPLVDNKGQPIDPGYLVAGAVSLLVDEGPNYRLLNAGADEAIVAAAEAARDAAEAAAESVASRIFADKANVEAATIPLITNRIEIQFFAPNYVVPGTLVGGHKLKRVASEPAHDLKIQSDDGAWWEMDERVVTPQMAGALGDGTNDDADAIRKILTYWKETGCEVVFPNANARYRMASSILIDLSGKQSVGTINMEGAIKPDAGIGRAITIRNARGGQFSMRVFGGGQTANYLEANPSGGDEAFVFVNAYGPKIKIVEGHEYAGRVLRMTSDLANLGTDGFRTQWVEIDRVYCNSSAKITDIEAVRLAKGVGQSLFIDSGLNAFGTIGLVNILWDLYGPVVENTSDITWKSLETLWRGNSGLELRGVLSFWGGKFNIGSELASGAPDLLRIISSTGTGARASSNIEIQQVFAIGGANGVFIENVGTTAGQGIKIGALFTRLNLTCGLKLVNTRKFDICHHSFADEVALETSGTCTAGNIQDNYTGAKKSTIILGSGADNIEISGHCSSGNRDNVASTPLIDVNTTGAIFFDKHFAGCDQSNFVYDLVGGNITRLDGGRITLGGSTAAVNGTPSRASDVVGLVTKTRGVATIPSGATSIVVTHGLAGTPSWVGLTARTSASSDNYVDGIGSTQFTIRVNAAVGADTPVLWEAALSYAG